MMSHPSPCLQKALVKNSRPNSGDCQIRLDHSLYFFSLNWGLVKWLILGFVPNSNVCVYVWCFPRCHQAILKTSAGCFRVHLSSTQRQHQIPQVKGPVTQDRLPLQMPVPGPGCSLPVLTNWLQIGGSQEPCLGLQSQGQVVTCISNQLAMHQRFPWPPP